MRSSWPRLQSPFCLSRHFYLCEFLRRMVGSFLSATILINALGSWCTTGCKGRWCRNHRKKWRSSGLLPCCGSVSPFARLATHCNLSLSRIFPVFLLGYKSYITKQGGGSISTELGVPQVSQELPAWQDPCLGEGVYCIYEEYSY